MNATLPEACASSTPEVVRTVRRLQTRIVKATQIEIESCEAGSCKGA
jgi:hypothetical protein